MRLSTGTLLGLVCACSAVAPGWTYLGPAEPPIGARPFIAWDSLRPCPPVPQQAGASTRVHFERTGLSLKLPERYARRDTAAFGPWTGERLVDPGANRWIVGGRARPDTASLTWLLTDRYLTADGTLITRTCADCAHVVRRCTARIGGHPAAIVRVRFDLFQGYVGEQTWAVWPQMGDEWRYLTFEGPDSLAQQELEAAIRTAAIE